MSAHASSRKPDDSMFQFDGNRLRPAARRIAGIIAAASGLVIAMLGNEAPEDSFIASTHLSIPLGIALVVLGVTLSMIRTQAARQQDPVRLMRDPVRPPETRHASGANSIASELALLTDLYSRGALSRQQFEAAKQRLLGS